MKRTIQIIFLTTFIIFIFLPIFFFNFTQTISQQENRALAAKPVFIKDMRLNANLFAECDKYFQDRFGFREQLIYINKSNSFKVEQSIFNKKAIAGKEGWYFYLADENLKDFLKRNLLTSAQIEEFSNNVQKAVDWCKEQNIPCVFLICPNKHSVYEEFYPFARPEGATRTDQITKVFEELHVPYIFPHDYLISQKPEFNYPLYIETDTHWNPQGAYLASTLLREKFESIFSNINFPQIEYKTEVAYGPSLSDLPPMLGIEEQNNTQIKTLPIGHNNYYTYIKNDGMNGIHTQGADKNLPRALIYRDSFFTALEPFVSPLFSEAEYIWKQFREEDKEYVLQYKPDIIIFEAVERYAPTIVQ